MTVGLPGSALVSLDIGGGSSTGPFTRNALALPFPRIYSTVPGDWVGFPSPSSAVPNDMPFLHGDGGSGSVDLVFTPLDAAGVERAAGAFVPETNGAGSLGVDARRWGNLFGRDAELDGLLTVKNLGGVTPAALFPGTTKMILSEDSGGASGLEIHANIAAPFGFIGGLVGVNESATLGTKMMTLTATLTSLADPNMGMLGWGVKSVDTDADITLFMLLTNEGRMMLLQSGSAGGISIGGADTPNIHNSGNDLVIDASAFYSVDPTATLGTIASPWVDAFFTKITVSGSVDPSDVTFTNQSSVPGGAPAAGYGKLWTKTDKTLHFTDEDGTDYDLTAAGGGFLDREPTTTSLIPITAGDAFGLNSISSTGIYDKGTIRGVGASDSVDIEISLVDSLGVERTGGAIYPAVSSVTDLGKSTNEFRDVRANRAFVGIVEATSVLYFKTNSTDRALIENDGKFKRQVGATGRFEAIGGCYDVDVNTSQSSGGNVTDLLKSAQLLANTLDTDGQSFTFFATGIDQGTLNTLRVELFNTGTVFTHTFSAAIVYWTLKIELVRENSATAKYSITLIASNSSMTVPTTSYAHLANGSLVWDWTDVSNQLISIYCDGTVSSGVGDTSVFFWRITDHPSPLSFI